jgi:hypothetical protein
MHAQTLLIPNANDELVTVAKAAIMHASFDDQALCTHRIHTTDICKWKNEQQEQRQI